jgi:hypothetical protein
LEAFMRAHRLTLSSTLFVLALGCGSATTSSLETLDGAVDSSASDGHAGRDVSNDSKEKEKDAGKEKDAAKGEKDAAKDTSEDTSEDTSQDTSEDTAQDSSEDTSQDSSMETSVKDASEREASVSDASSKTDGPHEAAADSAKSGACTGRDAADCVACCTAAHPAGRKKLETYELDCACKADLCGPLDKADSGRTDSGARDAGEDKALGHGDCANACVVKAEGVVDPSATCVTCLREATGTETAPGTCYDSVAKLCTPGTNCAEYVDCVSTCEE